MVIENEAGKLTTDYNIYSSEAFKCYKYFNLEHFQDFQTIDIFKDTIDQLCIAHNQFPNITYTHVEKPVFEKNKKVLLLCSGGLDSVYQAFILRDKGYEVTLLHLSNANYYSNGQEKKVVEAFAEKFNFPLIMTKIAPNFKSDYKKFWAENSFKDALLYTIAIDYMINLKIGNLSSGDDLRLPMANQALGVNTGDCREVTEAFMKSFGVNFIPVDDTKIKSDRLKKIYDEGAEDYYNSCVSVGRLTEFFRKNAEKKYNVKLDKYCCTKCRKCASHIAYNYYFNNMFYPKELIDECFKVMAEKADAVYFANKNTDEERREALRNY